MQCVVRIFVCLVIIGCALYSYIYQHNQLTELRMRVPKLAQVRKKLEEENQRLQFEIEKFENPLHLMELARKPEFSHLKQPLLPDIIIINRESQQAQEIVK
jgi:cell division protein FtsL